MKLRYLIILAFVYLFSAPAYAEFTWTWTTTCPESGVASPVAAFTSTTSVGFSGPGTCSRINTGFTEFNFTSTNATVNADPFYTLNTSDMMIIPPLLTWETKPIVAMSAACPTQDKSINWIVFNWKQNYRSTLNAVPVTGQNTFDTATGLQVDNVYDVAGNLVIAGPIALGGSCSSGLHALSGSGDRAGTVYFTPSGAGFYATSTEKRYFFLPVYTMNAANDLGSRVLPGYEFNSTDATSAKPARVTTDAAGTTWTIQAYADASAGTIDASYTDTVTISAVNTPVNGMMIGTLTRVGAGAGSGEITCIIGRGIATRVFCAGEQPDDNTIPYGITFVEDGPHIFGQDSGTSAADGAGINTSEGIFSDGTRLFISDTNNHRVLIWNSIPTTNQVTPNVILGQPDSSSAAANNGGRTAQSLSSPRGVYSDGTKLYVADSGNNRVLIWNTIPTVNQQSADLVLGQTAMANGGANAGGRSGASLSGPYGVHGDGSKLYISDNGNNRVLIFDPIPTVTHATASVVLGQTLMTVATANNGGISAATMSAPRDVHSDGTKLYVVDLSNHRVLVWNTIPAVNGTAADVILGQPDAVSATANNGGRTGQSLSTPRGVMVDAGKLYVADQGNNRVLIWNTIPTVTQQTADVVLGQPNMTSGTANLTARSASTMSGPRVLSSDGTKLYVLDTANFRALIWNTLPTVNQTSANVVQGQPSMSTGTSNSSGIDASTLNAPQDFFYDGTRVFVVDNTYHRVLIWNSMPTSNRVSADVVIGQPDMVSGDANNPSRGANTLNSPQGVFSDGTYLVVADAGNHRVLIWNSIPVADQTSADVVLGQPNFTSGTANNGGRNGKSMNAPQHVYYDGTRLYVADTSNNRVLVWNGMPAVNQTTAAYVLGQPNTTSGTANNGGRAANTLSAPRHVMADGTKLYVADTSNNRILIWNAIPTLTQTSADVVIGQPDFASATANNGGRTAQSLSGPYGVFSDGTRLFVSDSGNNRLLSWNAIPTVTQTSADNVFGQATMTVGTANNGGLTSKRTSAPRRVFSDGVRMWFADSANNRVVGFDVP